MSNGSRPLSPHLTIYRWPITMILSILHRMTGVALSAGFVVFVWWLESVAYDAMPYGVLMALFESLTGRLLLAAFSFAFFFHLANGTRHLLWDSGRLFEKNQADRSSWIVLVTALVLTAVCWMTFGHPG